ncbi:MAG: YigZ family protein [Synergistaceae bacterium]|nr:YigZ family protein [Synergistaceae bacterium]
MAETVRLFVFTAPRNDADVELTVKRSRFIGSIRIALSADEATELIKGVSALYPKANHHCWAYRVGIDQPLEHCSDAGEPAGTAGHPILGTIKRHSLDNTLIVVTRYFGGIKLGVRGLIDAYGQAAELAVTEAGTVEMELNNALEISCGYDYSKTITTTLRKWGFGDDRQNTLYGEAVKIKLEVPCSMRKEISPALDEMKARGFLAELKWDEKILVREKWT